MTMSSFLPLIDAPVQFHGDDNQTPMVSSLDVARHFYKKHKNVLAEIHKTKANLPESFTGLNFQPSEYVDPTGRKLPYFLLSRDAFSLLAMGFTGKAATTWKLRYIEAFNAMELALREGLQAAARLDGMGQGLAVPPRRRTILLQALRYKERGFSRREMAQVMNVHKRTLDSVVKEARGMGLWQ